jgi:hypothetical protein
MIRLELTWEDWSACVAAVSSGRRFVYTPRNLFYEALRRAAFVPPTIDPDAELEVFCAALARHERSSGPLPGLIRSRDVSDAPDAPDAMPIAPDAFDYAVRRVLVFERLDTLLLFAGNGFHRNAGIALVVHGNGDPIAENGSSLGFPRHIWNYLIRQLRSGLRTTFYAVHDCTASGYAMAGRLRTALAGFERARVADVGLTFPQAFELGAPVWRSAAMVTSIDASVGINPEEQLLLAEGNYLHLEQLRPLDAMRWVHGRVARRSEAAGSQ